MNIITADAFSNSQAIVVDSFRFTDTFRTLELNEVRTRPASSKASATPSSGETSASTPCSPRATAPERAANIPRSSSKPASTSTTSASSHSTLSYQVVAQDTPRSPPRTLRHHRPARDVISRSPWSTPKARWQSTSSTSPIAGTKARFSPTKPGLAAHIARPRPSRNQCHLIGPSPRHRSFCHPPAQHSSRPFAVSAFVSRQSPGSTPSNPTRRKNHRPKAPSRLPQTPRSTGEAQRRPALQPAPSVTVSSSSSCSPSPPVGSCASSPSPGRTGDHDLRPPSSQRPP